MAVTEETAALDTAGEACIPISVAQQMEFCYERGWTDGLPVVPATRDLVDDMLEAADETTLHYALDDPGELMLICAGSPIGLLSMVLPGFGGSKAAGRSRPIRVD